MCGRFSLTTPVEGIRRLFGFSQIPNLPARYNIAPTQAVLAVRAAAKGGEGAPPDAFMVRWGLIPSWAKEASIGARMINARAETITEKPAFKAAFRRRRCLIPADSFYEWRTENKRKQAYRIHFEDGDPFAFAGLWEDWLAPDGSQIESCSIVTTEAAPAIADIHHRMPVILEPTAFDVWMSGSPDAAGAMLKSYSGARELTADRIVDRVNNVRNDGPELWETAVEPEEGGAEDKTQEKGKDKAAGQLSLF